MMNFYTSFQISGDAQAINLTGRQRMLSQRMVKILYEIDQAREQRAGVAGAIGRAVPECKIIW